MSRLGLDRARLAQGRSAWALRQFPVFTGTERALWRFVRDRGGYWSTGELLLVAQRLLALPEPWQGASPHEVGGALKRMHSAGCLSRRERRLRDGSKRWAYGVTITCTAPAGETLEPAPVLDLGLDGPLVAGALAQAADAADEGSAT